jgi:hypothetical protein
MRRRNRHIRSRSSISLSPCRRRLLHRNPLSDDKLTKSFSTNNVSNFPREIAETALAHVIGDKAEQAYRRSDALEKRRKLMEAWASYCEAVTGNVVQTRKR